MRIARTDRVAQASTLLLVVATLATPGFVAQPAPTPAWQTAYIGLFLLNWTLLSVPAVVRLWRAGRGQATVARRRMRMLGLAAALVNAALLLSARAGNRESGALVFGGRMVGLAATVLFMLGFAPPGLLRALWRRREVAAFRRAESELMGAETVEDVTGIVLPMPPRWSGRAPLCWLTARGNLPPATGWTSPRPATVAARLPKAAAGEGPLVLEGLIGIRLAGGLAGGRHDRVDAVLWRR